MQNVVFDSPRAARIIDTKYSVYAPTLRRMGLKSQEFRAVGMVGDRVVVHPDDAPSGTPFLLRSDIVEIVES